METLIITTLITIVITFLILKDASENEEIKYKSFLNPSKENRTNCRYCSAPITEELNLQKAVKIHNGVFPPQLSEGYKMFKSIFCEKCLNDYLRIGKKAHINIPATGKSLFEAFCTKLPLNKIESLLNVEHLNDRNYEYLLALFHQASVKEAEFVAYFSTTVSWSGFDKLYMDIGDVIDAKIDVDIIKDWIEKHNSISDDYEKEKRIKQSMEQKKRAIERTAKQKEEIIKHYTRGEKKNAKLNKRGNEQIKRLDDRINKQANVSDVRRNREYSVRYLKDFIIQLKRASNNLSKNSVKNLTDYYSEGKELSYIQKLVRKDLDLTELHKLGFNKPKKTKS